MNAHGLTVSLAFGGKEGVAPGFGIAVILRYVLEFCTSVDEAVKVLQRVPAHMAYNVTLLDAWGQVRTVELDPLSGPRVTHRPLAVNHQGEFELTNYAMFSHSYERQQSILGKLMDPLCNVEAFVNSFEYSPLFSTNYAQGFGTVYTAIYNPQLRAMEYRWPQKRRMYQSFSHFEEAEVWVELS
jgi:predicted choloylglycine hydrolase